MLPRRKTLTERLAEMRKMREQPTQEAVRIPTASVSTNIKKGVFDIRIPEVAPQQVKNYKVATTEQELIAYLKRCEETGLCGFDYETTISDQYRKMVNDKRTNIEYLYSEKLLTDKELKSELKALNDDFLKAPLDPHKADICTVSLSAAPHEAIVVFIGNKGENQYKAKNPAESLKEVFDILDDHLFSNRKIIKIAVNLSFETKHTLKQGKYILSPVADPLVMWVRCTQIVFPEKILNPKNPLAGKGLKPMTKEVFGVEMQDFSALLEKHGVQFFSEISADHPDAVSYSAEDSDYAVQHYLYWREIAKQIDKYDEWLHNIEMPFTRVIGTMEYWGMPWDNEVAQAKLIEAEAKKEKAITEIQDIASSYGVETKLLKSANVNSIKHLVYNVLKAPVPRLSDKGNLSLNEENLIDLKFMLENKLESLKEEDLLVVDESYSPQKQAQKAGIMAREEHPNKAILLRLIKLLKDAQKMTTLISSHIIGRQNWLHPVTGRIHAKYHQWTETGRLGSREPNQQNTPAVHNDMFGIRNMYAPKKGKVLFLIDESGFELRILADRANDTVMQNIFINNGDMHKKTAATATGKPESEITKVERTHAKPINFGIAYCATEHALQTTYKTDYDIRKPLEECAQLIQAVKITYPRIPVFQKEIAAYAREHGYVETIYGFKRLLPNIKSTSQFLRQSDERRASNTPIQGSAADIMKRIQNSAYELIGTNPLYRNNVALVAQVHDEQIFELPEDLNIIKPFVEAIKAEMEKEPIPGFKTPLQADASIAYRWGEKMSYEKFLDSKKEVG